MSVDMMVANTVDPGSCTACVPSILPILATSRHSSEELVGSAV